MYLTLLNCTLRNGEDGRKRGEKDTQGQGESGEEREHSDCITSARSLEI